VPRVTDRAKERPPADHRPLPRKKSPIPWWSSVTSAVHITPRAHRRPATSSRDRPGDCSSVPRDNSARLIRKSKAGCWRKCSGVPPTTCLAWLSSTASAPEPVFARPAPTTCRWWVSTRNAKVYGWRPGTRAWVSALLPAPAICWSRKCSTKPRHWPPNLIDQNAFSRSPHMPDLMLDGRPLPRAPASRLLWRWAGTVAAVLRSAASVAHHCAAWAFARNAG